MKLSCTSSMVPGATLTEKAQNLKKWGYDGIGVFVDLEDWNEDLHAEVLSLEKNTGVHPCEFCFGGPIYGHLMSMDQPDLRKACKEMYTKAAQVCAELGGAVTELEYTLGPQDPLPLFEPYAKMSPEHEAEFVEIFKSIAAPVEGTDSYVLLEPCNRYETPYLNNVDDSLDVVKKTGMQNTGLLLDMFHLSIEEADIPAKIRQAGKYVKYVHLGDNNRLMPGHGRTDWKAIVQALRDIGFDGYMSLECCTSGDPAVTLPETAKFMKKLIEEVSA